MVCGPANVDFSLLAFRPTREKSCIILSHQVYGTKNIYRKLTYDVQMVERRSPLLLDGTS